jgi:hypothetical protein
MTIDPSVHIQSMVSIHWSKIGSPAHFSKWRKARKYSSIIGRGKYDGLKGLCQKICCRKTVKMKKKGIFFNKKLHRIRGLKGMCRNKIKRNHTHDTYTYMCMISLHFIPTHSL